MGDRDPITRSSTDEIPGQSAGNGEDSAGVGARHSDPPSSTGGGGYLDICTEQGSDSGGGIEMRELQRIGLSRVWLDVASVVGPRRFLEIWRLLDRDELIERHGRLRLEIPRFSLYRRYQRNRYIQALAAQGYEARDIQDIVQRELGESISLRHLGRLMKD